MEIGIKLVGCIIIDDDKNIQNLLSEILEVQGVATKGIGSNGQEAVELFEERKPDIVFLDVRMPKMNGIDALKKIKQIDSNAKVIMITADSSKNIEKILLNEGAITVIFKPFKIETIQKALDLAVTTSTVTNQITKRHTSINNKKQIDLEMEKFHFIPYR